MTNVKRVLIYRLGSLGDTIVALPALHLVARAFPDAERRMLTNFPVNVKAAPAAAILESTGLVHGFVRYAVGTRSLRELMALWWLLIGWRPQVVVYLAAARGIASAKRDVGFFRLCGVRWVIGAPLTEDMQKPRLIDGDGVWEPEAERLARNIAELGDAALDAPSSWDLRLTEKEERKAAEFLEALGDRPIITLSIGTKRQSKDWGKENWRSLVARLRELYPGCGIALCGAEDEWEASEYVAEGWRQAAGGNRSEIVNLCGHLSPRETAAVCQRSLIFIGHDSGPMHLAAAVQTPCVAVFSARNLPRVWFPYGPQHRVIYHRVDCWGCNLETCVIEKKKCIYSIEVEEVLEAVRSVVGESDRISPAHELRAEP